MGFAVFVSERNEALMFLAPVTVPVVDKSAMGASGLHGEKIGLK